MIDDFQAILRGSLWLLLSLILTGIAYGQDSPTAQRAESTSVATQAEGTVEIEGKITNPEGTPLANEEMTVYLVPIPQDQQYCNCRAKPECLNNCRDCCTRAIVALCKTDASGTCKEAVNAPPGIYDVINTMGGRFAGLQRRLTVQPKKTKNVRIPLVDFSRLGIVKETSRPTKP